MRQSVPGRKAGLPSFQAGYTLVELLVVMALAAILLGVALPSMTEMLNTQRSNAASSSFRASLNLARAEAIKRNARVVVCKSADGLSCKLTGGWNQGRITFHDVNNNAAIDADEQLIERYGALPDGLSLTGNTSVANYVSYSASGSAKLITGAFQAGTFTFCLMPASSADVQQIVLSSTGRARARKGVAADCQ